jgi:hypothetical protein
VYSIDENDYQKRINRDDSDSEEEEERSEEEERERVRRRRRIRTQDMRHHSPRGARGKGEMREGEHMSLRERRKERILELLDELKALIEED